MRRYLHDLRNGNYSFLVLSYITGHNNALTVGQITLSNFYSKRHPLEFIIVQFIAHALREVIVDRNP
eukprot:XP_001705340.1 Hypothetical protein GL50803_38948 [Giardia lamblia ATCC 50803]